LTLPYFFHGNCADDVAIQPNQTSTPVSVYARRWWPSKYKIDKLEEIVLADLFVDTLYTGVSNVFNITLILFTLR